jgi:hypothetical protein
MAEISMRTRQRSDRHTKAEMNRNRAESFGGAMTTRRLGQSDSPGLSSSRSRSPRSGSERNQSVMAGRAGSGTSGGAGRSRHADPAAANLPGLGIRLPKKSARRTPTSIKPLKRTKPRKKTSR